MKNLLLTLILAVMTLATVPALAKYSGGTGEPNDPYLISTPEDMNAVGADPFDWDKHFLLTADINMTGFTYTTAVIAPDTSSSSGGFQGTRFTGVFDGAGFRITNLTIDTAGSDNDYLGLFGCIDSSGLIRNLGVENVTITGGNESGHLGGLVGVNYGIISNCYAAGKVTAGDLSECLGGLVGYNNSGTITNCYSTGLVTGRHWSDYLGGLAGYNDEGAISNCYSTGSVTGGYDSDYLGGLVGYNRYGTISDCFSTGQVIGGNDSYSLGGLTGLNFGTISDCYATGLVTGGDWSENLGGLVGENLYGTISNCFSTGQVTGGDWSYWLGGLAGFNWTDATISNCFWDVNTSGMTYSDGGTGKTTDQMQTMSTFTDAGWDFTTPVWKICDGTNYPKLAWQIPIPGDFICPDGVDLLDLGVLTDNWLLPVLAGDLQKDGFIDFYDLAVFANAWQSSQGSPNWNPVCDIAPDGGDGFVGIDDLAVFITGWLQESATAGDIAPAPADKFVNFLDFAVFAENWLAGWTFVSPDIPVYLNWFGNAPTAAAMIAGYYDRLPQYSDLIEGDAATQTDQVNEAIASSGGGTYTYDPVTGAWTIITEAETGTGHIPDYALFRDFIPPNAIWESLKDMSSPSVAAIAAQYFGIYPHADNCLADFMHTSRDLDYDEDGYALGESKYYLVDEAIRNYFSYKGHSATAQMLLAGTSFGWEDFKNQIDAGKPVLFSLDTNGDYDQDFLDRIAIDPATGYFILVHPVYGFPVDENGNLIPPGDPPVLADFSSVQRADTWVVAVGYNDLSGRYACYNTRDSKLHRYDFKAVADDNYYNTTHLPGDLHNAREWENTIGYVITVDVNQ
jgi:hypothetical protein